MLENGDHGLLRVLLGDDDPTTHDNDDKRRSTPVDTSVRDKHDVKMHLIHQCHCHDARRPTRCIPAQLQRSTAQFMEVNRS